MNQKWKLQTRVSQRQRETIENREPRLQEHAERMATLRKQEIANQHNVRRRGSGGEVFWQQE